MPAAILWVNVNESGPSYPINDGQNIPMLPPPIGPRQASSIEVFGPHWITFWESPNYDAGDDSLWIAPPPAGRMWKLDDLTNVPRPHGNNQWNDRIDGVSFSGAPTGSNENRTIIWADGHITVGNDGDAVSRIEQENIKCAACEAVVAATRGGAVSSGISA